MDVSYSKLHSENQSATSPMLMERSENFSEHVIDIPRSSGDTSSSNLSHETTSNGSDVLQREERSSSNTRVVVSQPSTSTSNVSQIVASMVVLALSRNEHSHAPLFVWIVGYASGCVATLPLLYWRYRHRNLLSAPDNINNPLTQQLPE